MTETGGAWSRKARLRQLLRLPFRSWSSLRPSFAQFGEDHAIVHLLNPSTSGTYVDVGANDPIDGSNTAFLYFLGWSGLAIDPNPAFAAPFRKVRPRDTFLTVGVSEQPGSLTYHEFRNDKLNTFSDARAEQLRGEGTPSVATSTIPCRPLHELIRAHLGDRHPDLLSIDCEGMDLEVLRSARLDTTRPTVILIEDFDRYCNFRDGRPGGELDEYLRSVRYSPIWQAAWSSIYVANDWRDLPGRGFSPPRDETNFMPK